MRSFAISRPALDGCIPLLFELGKCISVEFVIEGPEIWEGCNSSRRRGWPFLEVEVAGRAEEEILEKN